MHTDSELSFLIEEVGLSLDEDGSHHVGFFYGRCFVDEDGNIIEFLLETQDGRKDGKPLKASPSTLGIGRFLYLSLKPTIERQYEQTISTLVRDYSDGAADRAADDALSLMQEAV